MACPNSANQSMFVRPTPLNKQDKTPPAAHVSRDINGPNQVVISHEISHLIYQSRALYKIRGSRGCNKRNDTSRFCNHTNCDCRSINVRCTTYLPLLLTTPQGPPYIARRTKQKQGILPVRNHNSQLGFLKGLFINYATNLWRRGGSNFRDVEQLRCKYES